VLLLCGGALQAAEPGVEAARAYRQANAAEILRDYVSLLSISNTAADQQSLRRTAEAIRSALAERGAATKLLDLPGVPPIVYGRLDVPGTERTLGIYLHYDGQPVDPRRWTHPPFEPTLYTAPIEAGGRPRPFPEPGEQIDPEWRLYARSAGDDKVPVPALLGALDALDEAEIGRTSNLVFFFEGEEESGSTHLSRYFETYRELVDEIDLWLICDGPVHQSRQPQLVFGVRGYTGLDIRVYGAERYLHSGHYGNWAPNPAQELARLLASLKDSDGRVRVPGFYDSVVPLTVAERAALARVPNVDEQLRNELGLARTEADNAPLIERILLPSLNIRGLESATVGESARNIIPTTAEASIDMRLVKANDPEAMLDLVERHIGRQGFHVIHEEPDHATRLAHPSLVLVQRRPGYPAARTRMDLPALAPVIAAAEAAADGPPVLTPSLGGSLPLHIFSEQLGKPLVIVPIANHDNNQHGPDENLRLANLWYGIDLFAGLLTMGPAKSQ
jgi:acetylornithine deacetylase/succinyl-diaminopimelate desuccinylase-like protein